MDVRGDAYTIPVTHILKNAEIGDVLLFDFVPGNRDDHGMEILAFEGSQVYDGYLAPQYIVVWTANWPIKCGVSVERIAWNDTRIKGVFRPLSTW